MKVSNNDFFNSVVKELYCPTIDLSSVTKYEIFKALPSTAYPGSYSSTIRLFDASNSIVCVIFYSGYSNSSDEALKALRSGYHHYQYRLPSDAPNQQNVKSIIDWDCQGFTAGVSHKGSIQIYGGYKDLNQNKSIALYLKTKGRNLFHPFYNIISAKLVTKYEGTSDYDWYLKVKDRKGIERSCVVNLYAPEEGKANFLNTEYGILEINSIPFSEEEELEVCAMFDSADGGLGMYKCANIDLSKWRPSPESGIIWKDNKDYPQFSEIVQNDGQFPTDRYRTINCIAYWSALEVKDPLDLQVEDKNKIDLSIICSKAQLAASHHTKFNLVFMPSTLSPGDTANKEGNIHYHFPEWVLNRIRGTSDIEDASDYSDALYTIPVTDIYDVNTNDNEIEMHVINWHNDAIRQLYKDSCTRIVNAIKNTPVSDVNTRKLIEYIDVVKVAFWGTWGEGIAYHEITGHNGNLEGGGEPDGPGPTSSQLIEISDHIISLFNEEDVFCLLPMMSYFNKSFPQAYRDYILNNSNPKTGYYFDGVGSNIAYWHEETAHFFDYTPEAMNKLCLAHQEKPIYLECSTHVSQNEMPTYQNLINFVRYFRCAYFNPTNIFFTNKDCKFNEIAMLKDISRYVGVKLGLLSFDYEYDPNANTIKIMLRFLNCGTAKIYHDNWKLRYDLIGENGNIKYTYHSIFRLRNIKAAFEEDAPNWHDVADFHPDENESEDKTVFNNNAETLYLDQVLVQNKDKFCISIEDSTGIYDNMYLCNSEDYIQRDEAGRYCLFTFSINQQNI